MSDTTFLDYVAQQMGDISQGVGEIANSAAANIGDSYQEILMAHASISPPDGLNHAPELAAPEPQIDVDVQ